MAKRKLVPCPNCGDPVAKHPKNDCVLGVMIQVIRERGTMPERKLRALHAKVDIDVFWTSVGKTVDALERVQLPEGRMKPVTKQQYRAAAKRLFNQEGKIEVDPNAKVSVGGDPGAYVQAWVWVYDSDITAEDK